MTSRPFPPLPTGTTHDMVTLASGLRVHVAALGDPGAPTVLLLHGWPQHHWLWHRVMGPLAASGLRVLAPDLRGAGWTEVTTGGYDKEQLASDLLELLDALGIERVHAVVGHDWGGWTAQLAALRAPQRFGRLALLNILPVAGAKGATARNAWRLLYQPVVGAPRLGPWLHRRALRAFLPQVPHRVPFAAAMREPERAEAGSRLYRTMVGREMLALLRGRYEGQRLLPPTLVLHGTGDPVVRPSVVAGFRTLAPDVRIEWLPGAGHFVVDERPEEVTRHLLAFLSPA